MAIDRFSRQEFEEALADILNSKGNSIPVEALGLVQNEYTYWLGVSPFALIEIRSSVDGSGIAADTGKDSIRLIIRAQDSNGNFHAIGKGPDSYTTRIPGWKARLAEKLRYTWGRAAKIKRMPDQCPKCSRTLRTFLSRSGKNPGRPFASCRGCKVFTWLDTPAMPVTPAPSAAPIVPVPQGAGSSQSISKAVEQEPESGQLNTGQPVPSVAGQQAIKKTLFDKMGVGKRKAEEVELPEREVGPEIMVTSAPSSLPPAKDIKLNDQQQAFVDAPVDANLVLSANAGSGKTLVIEHRVGKLVERGVDPDKMIVCTFSRTMADAMQKRILRTNPELARTKLRDQITTIHAICRRLLVWYAGEKRRYPSKGWIIKKTIEEVIADLWPDEDDRPGWKEVQKFIGAAKRAGLMPDEDEAFYAPIRDTNGRRVGPLLDAAREEFDRRMANDGLWTYSDMVLGMDYKLRTEPGFRNKMQSLVTHVIVDEGQDTFGQAIRILVTLSLEPGDNRVYDNWRPYGLE